MSRALAAVRLHGPTPYAHALKLQMRMAAFVRDMAADEPNVLLMLEHPHTFTAGYRLSEADNDEARLRSLGADFHRTNRGGQLTYHGPGQMVFYPIVNLRRFKDVGLRGYVHALEECAIRSCGDYGLVASRTKHAGVWLGNRKVCAVGVHAARFITMHGLALNCSTDLKWFDQIVPCGIDDAQLGVTSLSQALSRHIAVDDVYDAAAAHLADALGAPLMALGDTSKDFQRRVADVIADRAPPSPPVE